MSVAEIKLDLITWLSKLEDTKAIDDIAQIKKQFIEDQYHKSLKPMSMDELRDSLAEAEVDYANGRIVSQEELEERIKKGKIL
ncbi:hypothetical protein [Algoriphagus yeomjeoni]|uniref:Addiction module component n=1 Tax=Algoriphagus yeomjeoni TaxID=291403 RepID=A0A327PRN3_9BACT|nr:hypothetical protein [Algoriphagus yeomjeoni]RAI94808.1 hypothetical protein LV83_00055 [Algoriphagus yeomjeoni]